MQIAVFEGMRHPESPLLKFGTDEIHNFLLAVRKRSAKFSSDTQISHTRLTLLRSQAGGQHFY